MEKVLDLLIADVKVVDGTGNTAYISSVGIQGEKIVYIGKGDVMEAKQRINGEGLCLAPGFIDSHAHHDISVFTDDPENFNKLSQGITTEISGNCGIGAAPISDRYYQLWKTFLLRSTGGDVPDYLPEFKSHKEYFERLSKTRYSFNPAYHIGQGALRAAVMGFENRTATSEELDEMKELVRIGMENGALGLSTGLIFPPGAFTPFEELVELCKIVKSYGGVYATHVRNESRYLLDAIREAIEIGKQTGVSIQISHLKVAGKPQWGLSPQVLELIEDANRKGVEVFADMYPYTAANTPFNFIIPPQYMQEGAKKMSELLSDKSIRKKMAEEMLNPVAGWDSYLLNCGYEGVMIMAADKTPEAVGKNIEQYAREKEVEPIEAIFDILADNGGAGVAAWFMLCEEDMRNFMKSGFTMFGTDGIPVPKGETTHPRIIGAYPRILGRYVRESGVLGLEEAVRKMTSFPAQRFGLKKKGLIKEGYDADLVLFDTLNIRDCADYTDCYAKNRGIRHVIVNGQIVISDNEFQGCYPGKLVKLNEN